MVTNSRYRFPQRSLQIDFEQFCVGLQRIFLPEGISINFIRPILSFDNLPSFQWARSNPNFNCPVNSNDLEKTSRNRLETLSCPKLFPIEETSKLSFPVGTYRQPSKSARNSPVSLRPELLKPSSSSLGISNCGS